MDIYWIRHGKTESNSPVRFFQANEDDPLSPDGEESVYRTAEELFRKINPTKRTRILCCTSKQLRTQESTRILNDVFKFNMIHEDERIGEVNFGQIEGKTEWTAQDKLHPLLGKDAYVNQVYDYTSIGGESFDQVQQRIKDFKSWLVGKKTKFDVALISSHAANIRAWYKTEAGIIVPKVPHASWHKFTI